MEATAAAPADVAPTSSAKLNYSAIASLDSYIEDEDSNVGIPGSQQNRRALAQRA
jgi:hypothetical protein